MRYSAKPGNPSKSSIRQVKLYSVAVKTAVTGFFLVLFMPTVYLNSSYWGQCDIVYTTAVLACIYFLCVQKERIAFICFGLAFSFKLQAIFLLPLLLFLLFKKAVSLSSFLLIPFTYIIAIFPAYLAGRSFQELLLTYFNQSSEYKELTMAAPNIYQWLPNEWYSILLPLGIGITLTLLVIVGWSVCKSNIQLQSPHLVELSLLVALLVPYFLPKMHERYFFMADIFSIVFGLYFPKYIWVPHGNGVQFNLANA